MDKKELRKMALEKRAALSPTELSNREDRIVERIQSLPVFHTSRNILIYYSVQGEVGTLKLIRKWKETKQFFLPRLISDGNFLALPLGEWEKLETNRVGIPEPPMPGDKVYKPTLDLILMPGVAFDREGNRIGMGKGYYDRFLSETKGVPRVALAHSEQILDRIPHKPYDEPVDWIITEREVIRCRH